MRKETKIILILLAMALVVGCSSGCDGGEGVALDDETIQTLLFNPDGWVAQDDYEIDGSRIVSLYIENDPSTEISIVYFLNAQGFPVDNAKLQKGEEGYFLVCDLGECSLKVSANASLDKIDLTLTNQEDTKYFFASTMILNI